MNRCVGCGAEVGVFVAFCTTTCEGIFGFEVDRSTWCCPQQGEFVLAGFTARGVPVFGCSACQGHVFQEEHPEREIVVKVGEVPSLTQKLEAMRLQGPVARGVQ